MSVSLERSAEKQVISALQSFRVVAVVGPRQAGKTTLARIIGERKPLRTFVTLDDLGALAAARADPHGFIRGLRLPVTIDEVQRAPDLLVAIKREVDQSRTAGNFLLTGSADPHAVAAVRETLAGRMAMIPLRPLTWSERVAHPHWNPVPLLLDCRSARDAAALFPTSAPDTDLGEEVPLGGFPEPALHLRPDARSAWHDEFVRTYIERDVPLLVRPDDIAAFLRLVRVAASATGSLLNISDFARDAGVAHDTARRWLSVLQSTFLTDLLPPYWRNVRKRLVKTPKLHFVDTALAMSLLGLEDWNATVPLGLSGALTESWVHHHLRVHLATAGRRLSLHFFRSAAGEECDFVIESGRQLIPIEVKASSTVAERDARGVRAFRNLFPREAPFGLILYPGSHAFPAAEGVLAVPMAAFLRGEGASRE
jgi:uncharacterized protein